jgi:heme A synthase
MMLVGATGAIAALGDTLFPAGSLVEGLAADLDPSSHLLLRLRGLHPLIAVVVSLLLLQLAGRIRRRVDPTAKSLANWLTVAVFLQVALGGLNVVLLAPVWMQLVHLAMADVVWITLVMALAAAFTPAAPAATVPQKRSMSSSIT